MVIVDRKIKQKGKLFLLFVKSSRTKNSSLTISEIHVTKSFYMYIYEIIEFFKN